MFLKTFSTTMMAERKTIASDVNEYIGRAKFEDVAFELHPSLSSDDEFHCLTITLVSAARKGAKGAIVHNGEFYRTLRVASATLAKERTQLGDLLGDVADGSAVIVLQSSDASFHCLVYLILEP